MTSLAQNLIRKVITSYATTHGKEPCRLNLTLTCQTIPDSWIPFSTGSARNAHKLWGGRRAASPCVEYPSVPAGSNLVF